MPLAPFNCDLIFYCTTKFNLTGRFLSLGRLTPSSLHAEYIQHKLQEANRPVPKDLKDYPRDQPVSDKDFLRFLGYEESLASDAGPYEGAEIIHDLNNPNPPAEWVGTFDVVYNNGTIEHVFNLPSGLRCCHEFLRPGGTVIHSGPTNNMVDHGFYQISPTLYLDYYRANKYKILNCILIHTIEKDGNTTRTFHPYITYEYPTDNLYGKLGEGRWGIFFIAQKTKKSTSDVIPTQHRYVNVASAPIN